MRVKEITILKSEQRQFDTHVMKYFKREGKTVEGVFLKLVETIAKECSSEYIEHLIRATKTRDMLGLSNYIVKVK